jgi:hypothetical protein
MLCAHIPDFLWWEKCHHFLSELMTNSPHAMNGSSEMRNQAKTDTTGRSQHEDNQSQSPTPSK